MILYILRIMRNYVVDEHYWENSLSHKVMLHSHHEYEIYMFLEGDCYYVVDGRRYELSKGDIIIIRKHQMHRVFHNSFKKYHCMVIFVYPEFFAENNCLEYEKAFLEASKDSKIDAQTAESSGLTDAMYRIRDYSENFKATDKPVVKSTLIEILYIINGIRFFQKPLKINKTIREVIDYLGNNFTRNISLDELSNKFFISKYHLCRIFKQTTGLTVLEYLKRKRLTLAMELKNEGLSLSEASSKAGFKDYPSFYRYYKKKNKTSPTNKEN